MKKYFSRLIAVAAIALATCWANIASAQMLYTEGKDYTVLENPLPLQKEGQAEVLEFYSYACPHCADMEPAIIKWSEEKKPENVGFYQLPAVGGKMWTFVARAKYTAQKLGLGHDFDLKYFDAVHKKHNRRILGAEEPTIDFIATEGGVDKADVEKAWNSLQVKSNLKKSAELWNQAGLTGVPSIIVNGKYLVELDEYDKLFAVVNFLLETKPVE